MEATKSSLEQLTNGGKHFLNGFTQTNKSRSEEASAPKRFIERI
jgi:hypothetical protein